MKKNLLLTTLLLAILQLGMAQKDTTIAPKSDTIKIAGIKIIIKNNRKNNGSDTTSNDTTKPRTYSYSKANKKPRNVATNYFAIDLGFNNYKDATNYTSVATTTMLRPTASTAAPKDADFKLNTGKSINFNIWIVQQKLNLYKHILNLKYGIGLEIYNFRFKSPLTFKDENPSYIIKDSISFSKNKLTVKYVTVPLMFTISPSGKKGFSLSAGASVSYRYGAHTKQKSSARGKEKDRGDFDLEPFKIALVGDIGYKSYRLFASYSLNTLHSKGLNLTPYSVGLRFHDW